VRGEEGSSITLWEMNKLLLDTDTGGTIHDNIEYRRFLQGIHIYHLIKRCIFYILIIRKDEF
jgi:hypothetical protein